MSPSLRQFMIISIIGMTLLLVLLLFFHVKLSKDYLETHLDTHNKNLAMVLRNSLLTDDILQGLSEAREALPSSLRNKMDAILDLELQNVPVVKVKIYSRDSIVLYSTLKQEIGDQAKSNQAVVNALGGQTMSSVVYRDRVNEFDGTVEVLSLHQQYIPIKHTHRGDILGVFEIYTDITAILSKADEKQQTVFWSIGGGLLLFYLALAFSFLGTHRLLRRETRQRLAHLEELQEIRADLERRVEARTAELDKSKNFLQSVIDGIGNPLLVIRPDYSIALMNKAARDKIPTDGNEKSVHYCYQVSHNLDRPCAAPDHPCSFSRVMEHGCTARVRHTHYNRDDRDGRLVLLDLVSTPLYSMEGNFEGVIEVEHDITRLVEMQSGLEQSEARLQAIMDNVPDAILTCDSNFIIQSINPAAQRLFNGELSDLVGESFTGFLDDPVQGEALTVGETAQLEAVLKRVKGREFSADIWIGPLQLGDSDSNHIAVVHDITRRLQAQQELETTRQQFFHQEKMAAIGHLAAGILHEVGNPIAAIAGAASDLKTISIDDNSAVACDFDQHISENIHLINEQTTRLSKITREIADFASPKPREREILDLNGLLNSTARLLSYDQRFRLIKMDLDLDKYLPAIWGVADQLTQVFMNLLINAMDASIVTHDSQQGILLQTRLEGESVVVTVQDFGVGMSEEILGHVREPFFTTKPVGKGSGLGLSLCDTIIAAHGGKMNIHSEQGRGTSVQVTLPIKTSDD